MNKYTVGALFTPDFKNVLLIEKQRPAWQKGRLNFPGGHVENETAKECIVREFFEETGLNVSPENWQHIGKIENEANYHVEVFTSMYYPSLNGEIINKTDETCNWYTCDDLPENVISNIKWLVPFAVNFFKQGNADYLRFGHFKYQYEPINL